MSNKAIIEELKKILSELESKSSSITTITTKTKVGKTLKTEK